MALSGSFLPVIYPCHHPMLVLVVWPGPCCCCSISVCGVVRGHRLARHQHRCKAHELIDGLDVSRVKPEHFEKLHTAMDQVDISLDAITSPHAHATPRCEARRFNVRRIVDPGDTAQDTRWAVFVYGRVHFSDESSPAAHGLVPHPTLVVAA